MFSMSFGELLLIAIVALVVLGPEKLPEVGTFLGRLVGKTKRFVEDLRNFNEIIRPGEVLNR